MPSDNVHTYKGFDIVERHDGSFAVYDYAWWPDEELDNDPEANARWLEATGGYRAKGWIIVHVAPTLRRAHNWAHNTARMAA